MSNRTLKEQAWQSGLVLFDENSEWNETDWPPLEGGWCDEHAAVVLDHPHQDDHHNHNNRRQTVVVLGGFKQGQGYVNSVLALNLAEPNKQWREGPPMNQKRYGHAAVVCNGGVYVMGGNNGFSGLDCIERIDVHDMLQSSRTTTSSNPPLYESPWTTLTCRLSARRYGFCAVAVQNRYLVVIGGYNEGRKDLSSVDILDTTNHSVTAGPSMTIPRQFCTSAVIGHRIFVVGGRNEDGNLDSLEYFDFERPCDSDETKKETGSTFISFSSNWTAHSNMVLSNARSSCAVVTVGSCLVVAGGWRNSTVEVLDTHRNRVWSLPSFVNHRTGCSMVNVADHVAVIGGYRNPSCATLPLLDRISWCFRRLCEQQPNRSYHCQERSGKGNGDVNVTSWTISTSILKRLKTNT